MSADLAAIRTRLAAAGPGPWKAVRKSGSFIWHEIVDDDGVCVAAKAYFPDAELIAHAPEDLAALCDELEDLCAALIELRHE